MCSEIGVGVGIGAGVLLTGMLLKDARSLLLNWWNRRRSRWAGWGAV